MKRWLTDEDLPVPVKQEYGFANPMFGGPVFAFKCGHHDITKISLGIAHALVAEGVLRPLPSISRTLHVESRPTLEGLSVHQKTKGKLAPRQKK